MMPVVVGAIVVLLALAAFFVLAARRRGHPSDDIDSFRRQIDALSPEARRQTSERMKPSDGRSTDDDGANGT